MKGLIFLPKIKINYFLKTNNEIIEKKLNGIYHDNIITFKDNNVITSILLNNNILKRESNDYIINIDLNNISCKYYFKKENKYIDFDIHLNNYTKDDNSIHIDYYIIYDNINRINILFKINYEVIK